MRPFRSFLLLLIFLVCFTGLYYIFPHHGLLKLPFLPDFIPIDLLHQLSPKDSDFIKSPVKQTRDSLIPVIPDTLYHADSIPFPSAIRLKDPLQEFLDSLQYSKDQVRILYYGDSQIEGDRVTSYIRKALRKGHAGTGPGLFLPLMPVMYTKSVYIRSSSNWKRYNYLSYKNGELSHNNLGPFMTLCRYLPEGVTSSNTVKAWIRIVPSKFADSTTTYYDNLRIFYGNARDIVNIEVTADGYLVVADTLTRSSGLNEFSCPLYFAKNILIEFSGRTSPDIYGISIESKTGIVVDNIPQRGSAGLEFTMVDKETLKEIYQILSPDLLVLHYGLNIVKNVRKDYSYYQKGLYRQLSLLKEVSPETKFIVVGLTEMASGEGDSINSYPNIPAIIDAQIKAAKESGAIFWNSYDAMGGKGSIIKWAKMNPPLAQKDYVHLTNSGADTLSKMLVSQLFQAKRIDTLKTSDTIAGKDTISLPRSDDVPIQQPGKEDKGFLVSLISYIFSYHPDKPFIFSNAAFWIFFLLVLGGYSIIYKKLFIRNLYLFLISLFFYYKSGGLFLTLLIIVTFIDFLCGLLIYQSKTKKLKRIFILVSIISNVGILAYFKYTGFFINTLNDLLGTHIIVQDFLGAFSNNLLHTSFDISYIILPVGISFFTFQSLSYTFDVYRNKLEPVRNIIDFGFYVSFFPQLVAGPIVRASEFIPQLYKEFHLTKREFSHALFLISKGLIKKIIISDFIAVNFVDRVFDLPGMYSGFENLMAIYGYGLQIYCDFSGYTDIAIGIGLIFGFRLPVNFNSPYKASSIADFWKRWHISLSRWLKDYLYIPLGGNRKGRFRTIINLMITMLLGGLWHGAAFRFIFWGGLHGLGLVINKIWNYIFGKRPGNKWYIKALTVFITFHFVTFCWIFFRAPDMNSAFLMISQMTGNFSPGSYLSLITFYSTVFSLIAAGYLIHFLPEKLKESYRGFFIRIPLVAQMVVIMLIAIMLFQMRTSEILPFIYFRF